ncbi:MAG: hypothetical protein PHE54_03480 [Bacilli bacterium]|nr:hypothetical protein [Bacilli bacterium]
MKTRWKFILMAVLVLITVIVTIRLSDNITTEKQSVLMNDTLIDYEKIGVSNENIISVYKDGKVGFIDNNGHVITDCIYSEDNLSTLFYNGYAIISDNNYSFVINKQGERIFENNYDYIYNLDDYFIVSNNGQYGLVDATEKVLVPINYDNVQLVNSYILAYTNAKYTVYDLEGHVILENVDIKTNDTNSMVGAYEVNDNFIVVLDGKYSKVFLTKTSEFLNSDFANVSLSDDYAFVSNGEDISIYNKDGEVIGTIDNDNLNYWTLNNNYLAIADETCESNNENWLEVYNLYDIDGNEITSGCNSISSLTNNDLIVVLQNENKDIKVYNNDKLIIKRSSDISMYVDLNEFNNIIIYENYNSYLYDTSGNIILDECSFLKQLSSSQYLCEPVSNIGYLTDINGNRDDKVLSDVYSSDNLIKLTYADGSIQIIDKYNNDLFAYDEDIIRIIDDDYLVYQYNNEYYIRNISYVDKKTASENVNNVVNLNENGIDYSNIDIDEIIETYELTDIDLINNNQVLFKKISYHIINNTNLSFEHKQFILNMFNVFVDFSKENKLDKLLNKLDQLTIEIYQTRPQSMQSWAAGDYMDTDNKIRVLDIYEDYALAHEVIHFISFSRQGLADNYSYEIYNCSNQYLTPMEVINLSFDEQKECTMSYITYNNFFEEVGAEYYAKYYYNQKPYESYYNAVLSFNLLKYVLKTSFIDLEYSPYRETLFYQLVSEKLSYDNEEINTLYNKFENIIKEEQYYNYTIEEISYNRYSLVDSLINIYKVMYDQDWKEDELFKIGINALLDSVSLIDAKAYADSNNLTIKYYTDYVDLANNDIKNRLGTITEDYLFISSVYVASEPLSNEIIVIYYDNDMNEKTISLFYNETGNFVQTNE